MGFTSVTPKLDSLVNEVIRSFSLNTLILLNDVITMKLVYRLTIEHTYIYYFRPRSPRAWGGPSSPGLQFYRGNIWSFEGVGYTSPQENPPIVLQSVESCELWNKDLQLYHCVSINITLRSNFAHLFM